MFHQEMVEKTIHMILFRVLYLIIYINEMGHIQTDTYSSLFNKSDKVNVDETFVRKSVLVHVLRYSSRNIPNFRKCVYFYILPEYIHEHIAYYHCAKDQIENRTPKVLISRFKYILYDYFDSCLIFKTPMTQNSKSTSFANL